MTTTPSKDKFVPHKNAPGPVRLEVERADNSGTVNTDPMFIADRQAIINHVMAYAFLIDEGRWDDWFALFSDDVSFETTAPEVGTLILKGKKPFQAFVGFTKDEVIVALDPSTKMPGAPEVAVPVKGQITLKNHPFSTPANGPLYQNAPIWNWTGIDVVIVDYLTTAAASAAFLPEQCTTVPIPELSGYSLVKQIWAKYPDTSFGPYNEFMPVIPCLFNGQPFLHVPLIYVDNDCAMAAGRETGGWPKKLAKISMDRIGNEYRCSFERQGKQVASAKINIGGSLFSTPLPADRPVSLPFPYNMTLPLPPPTGKAQESVPFPTTTIKLFPAVDGGSGTPVVARLIGSPWHMKGTFFSGSGASVAYHQSENDPCYKLPVLKVLGAMYLEGDMTLKFSEMTVLDDMLKK